MESLPDEFFGWILPTIKYSINYYLPMGLDAYFFLRFISILLIFFSTCGTLNLIVLVPVNYSGNSATHSAAGLDRLSITNISPGKITRLNAHFVCGLITIVSLSALVIYELDSVVKIRHSYVRSDAYRRRLCSRVLLLGHVPHAMRNKETLKTYFEGLTGKVEHIWFVDDFEEYWWKWSEARYALDLLEEDKVRELKRLVKKKDCSDKGTYLQRSKFFPSIFLPLVTLPGLQRTLAFTIPGCFRVIGFPKRGQIDCWAFKVLGDFGRLIQDRKKALLGESFLKRGQVFIEFKSQEAMHIAYQVLLSLKIGQLDRSLTDVNPDDILWWNINREDNLITAFQSWVLCVLFIVLCALYVIPVSFITLLSQIPTLVRLVPLLSWLEKLPQNIRDVVSGILPSLLLNALTDLLNRLTRRLAYLKGMWTGSELELSLQRWYFNFLFIQQFLVVSILSSLSAVMLQILNEPASIPTLFATNIPKSATFFFKFLPVQAFAICGGSFLQLERLILRTCFYLWWDITPRAKLRRLRDLPKVKWGSIYPSISVFGSIGITYCVISPMISLFTIVNFSLILVCYKYSLHYVFHYSNPCETFGRLYPRALFQLYSGVYCLELYLIGACLSQQDESGQYPLRYHGLFMVTVFFATVTGNIFVYQRFARHIENIAPVSDPSSTTSSRPRVSNAQMDLTYLHPSYRYEKPELWLPEDELGIAKAMLADLVSLGQAESAIVGGSVRGAKLVNRRHWVGTKLCGVSQHKQQF